MSRSPSRTLPLLTTALLAAIAMPAHAQSHGHHDHGHGVTPTPTPAADHAAMDHSTMGHSKKDHGHPTPTGVDHSTMDHSKMDHSKMDHGNMDHASMDHAAMGHGPRTAPREPIPVVTEADRLAAFPAIDHAAMQHAPAIHSMLLINRLEHWDGQHGTGQAWEASGWVGGDINRLWVRSEGERSGGRTEASDLELLYGRSVSPWWDVLVGVKQDMRPADSRTWAALGIQGLAPYKFETSATAYLGEGGQVAATVEVEYELLLTKRLILQPLVEATFSAKDEPRYGNGSGLNTVEAGLRLRYEISRRFAPYVGISHERLFGDTADYHRAAGEPARDTRWVAGVRVWF